MALAAQLLNYDVSPLELLLHDYNVQIELKDFQPKSDFFPLIFCFLIMYECNKRNNILVIYVSSGCKFLFWLSLSLFASFQPTAPLLSLPPSFSQSES